MLSLVGVGEGWRLRVGWDVDSRLRFRRGKVGRNCGGLELALEASMAASVVMKQDMGAAVGVAKASSPPPPGWLSATPGTGRMMLLGRRTRCWLQVRGYGVMSGPVANSVVELSVVQWKVRQVGE
jgi:hypothetical protein